MKLNSTQPVLYIVALKMIQYSNDFSCIIKFLIVFMMLIEKKILLLLHHYS